MSDDWAIRACEPPLHTGPQLAQWMERDITLARRFGATMNNEARMPKSMTNTPDTLYCPNCHIATRTNCERCLHCGKPLRTEAQTRALTATLTTGRERS